MNRATRPLTVAAAPAAIALGGAGTALACDASGTAEATYPGQSTADASADYPTTSTTSTASAASVRHAKARSAHGSRMT